MRQDRSQLTRQYVVEVMTNRQRHFDLTHSLHWNICVAFSVRVASNVHGHSDKCSRELPCVCCTPVHFLARRSAAQPPVAVNALFTGRDGVSLRDKRIVESSARAVGNIVVLGRVQLQATCFCPAAFYLSVTSFSAMGHSLSLADTLFTYLFNARMHADSRTFSTITVSIIIFFVC